MPMTPITSSFISNPLPSSNPKRYPCTHARSPPLVATASAPFTAKRPDAGLITKSGITGTLCANLWPVPILGDYSWFLNVYNRDMAASVGPFVITNTHEGLHMEFCPDQKPQPKDHSQTHHSFPGIAAGNMNVRQAVDRLKGRHYKLMLFEKGGSENFLQRRNEVHILPTGEPNPEQVPDVWHDPAPTFRTISRASSYEVREVFAGGNALPRATSALEYFAMNLFPIFPLSKYSCFVAVWKQRDGLSPVAIDKRGQVLRLSFFDPLEISEQDGDSLPPIARFAVKVFCGAITDDIAATQHKILLDSIASSPSTRALSPTDFRLVVDNTPGTVTPNRRNEMWVQVS